MAGHAGGHARAPAAADAYATAKAQSASGRQVVEGWETGEIPAADLPVASQTAGWEPTGVFDAELLPEIPAAPGDHAEAEQAAAQLGFGDDEAVADFFSVTEEELKVRDREARRVNRGERVGGRILRTFIVLAVIVVLAGAGLVGAFYMGFGWPTQSQSVSGMLEAHGSGKDVTPYWVAVPDKDVAKEMAKIPPIKTFTVDGVVRAAQTSTVTITVTPKSGAPLHYRVTLTREGVGWKVSGVENDWRSTGG